MNVTSTIQTQYNNTKLRSPQSHVKSTNYELGGTGQVEHQDNSQGYESKEHFYELITQKQQPTRYETLLAMNYDNMSEVERKELSYWHGMRSIKSLDEEGNKALNKALEGKTDIEKSQIKSVLELEFMTSIKANHTTQTVDRQKFDSIDTSKNATIDRFETFIVEFEKNGSVNNIGLIDVMNKFLGIYKNSEASFDLKNQEDSVIDKFLEDLYSKESISFASSKIKDDIQNKVDEYEQMLLKQEDNSEEAKPKIAQMLHDYKKELLQEYKESLEKASDDSSSLEQQAMIKVLLDENSKEASSLEKLLAIENKKQVDNKDDTKTELTNIPTRWLDAINDKSNTFGMFLKENDKALNMLDKFVENMSEDEKSRFIFVFGHTGDEHLLKAMSVNNLSSPQEAMAYVSDEVKQSSKNEFFAQSLEKMFNDKAPKSETKRLLEEFYKLYTRS